jgi:hypothetical protein
MRRQGHILLSVVFQLFPNARAGSSPGLIIPWRRRDPSLHHNVYLERIGSLG